MEQKFQYMVYVSCMTYNHAPYITDALDGFCKQQTTFPFVCGIIDDASTDGEPDLICQYFQENFDLSVPSLIKKEETDDYVMIYARHKENNNCYFAVYYMKYNHHQAGRKSKLQYVAQWFHNSKYYAICEGDDYWIDPLKLQTQVEYMENTPKCVLTHTAFDYLDEGSFRLYDADEKTRFNLSLLQSGGDIKANILDSNRYLIQTVTVLMKNEAFQKALKTVDEYKGKYLMGDTLRWLAVLDYGDIHFFEQKTSVYRLHGDSATHQTSIDKQLRFQLSCSEMRVAMAEKYGVSEEFKSKFYHQYNNMLTKYLWFDRNYEPFIQPRYRSILEKIIHGLLRGRLIGGLAKIVYSIRWNKKIK